jgi:ACS family glucarate transporter-like MFS transporter
MPPFRFQPDFSFINLAPVWCYRSPSFGGDSSPYLLPVCLPRLSGAVIILVLVRFALGAGEATMYPATSQFVHPTPGSRRAVPWARILTSKEVLALTLSYFCFGYVAWVFFGWFYIYLAQARGLNLKTSAGYSMLPFVGMTIGCLSGGVASDWMAHRFSLRLGRCLLPASSMALNALLLVFGSRTGRAETAGMVLALGVGILYVSAGCFWAVSANFAREYAGLTSGIMNMGAQIGGACTTSLTPLIAAHFGWQMSFFIAALFAASGAIAWLIVDPKRSLLTPQISA